MNVGGIVFPLIIAVFFAIGIGILGWGGRSFYLAKQAAHWPTSEGTILSSRFETNYDSESGDTFQTHVRYQFSANGRMIEGDRIAFGYTGSSSERYHREIHKALKENTRIAVRFHPSHPERCVLSFGVNQSILFIVIFGAIWTTFMIGFVAIMRLGASGAGSLLDNMVIYGVG